MMKLSNGVLLDILNGSTPDRPVFQVISTKKIESKNTVDRYRLLLSDGEYQCSQVMLAAQLNKVMANNDVTNYSVIEATKFMCNKLQGDKSIIILLDFNVLAKGEDVGAKIGNPVLIQPNQLPAPKTTSNTSSGQTLGNTSSVGALKPQTASLNSMKPILQNQGGQNNSLKASDNRTTPTTPTRVHTIASLTPYQNRWRIRARVTLKSSIRNWSNSRGTGRLFNVNLLDDSGEIRCTGFNEQVDKYYPMLEVNKIFYFSKCTLKTADKRYSSLNSEYEMTMNPETIIEPCNDDVDLPTMNFDFVKISDLEKCKVGSNVDVIGVVKVCNDIGTVIAKQSQKEITKRDIQIVDQSGVAVNLTLWGEDALKFDGQGYPVVAGKGVKVSDFGGRSLSVQINSQLMVNPDVREANILRGWFENEGRDQVFSTFQNDGFSGGAGQTTNWKLFLQVKMENLGQGEKADYFTAKGTVIFIKKDNCMYQACPTADCNKKVVDQGNGLYRCEKCNREFPNYKWRMILSVNIADHTDNQWITCFQESAETVLGIKAEELGALRQNDEVQFDQVMQNALFKHYNFRLRAKVETYNEENRLKTVCVGATSVDWKEAGHRLSDLLSQMGLN